jgi:Nop53 (60S ribosomal biogenesis)
MGYREQERNLRRGNIWCDHADCSGIVREKPDFELFSIDDVGAQDPTPPTEPPSEPPNKRRRPLRVDEILGTTTETAAPIASHVPKRHRTQPPESRSPLPEPDSFDVWNKVSEIPAPQHLPPPSILPYSKSVPALPPTTLRTSTRLLRSSSTKVAVPEAGQSYNPALQDWEEIIQRSALGEERRLERVAVREFVARAEEVDTPFGDGEEEEEEEEAVGESFLAKPVQVIRKTRAQRNKHARQLEQVPFQ